MSDSLSIGQLASAVDLPASTLRYYEREGLLRPLGRNSSNYRVYDHSAVDRLRFIRAGQRSGPSLGDLRVLLEFREGNRKACGEVREVLDERLTAIEAKIAELTNMQAVLQSYHQACLAVAKGEECPVLVDLDSAGQSGDCA